MRTRLSAVVLACAVLGGAAFADLVTYDIETNANQSNVTFGGSITWDSATISTPSDLTFGNATGFTFNLVAGANQFTIDEGDTTLFIDDPRFDGGLGAPELRIGPGGGYRLRGIRARILPLFGAEVFQMDSVSGDTGAWTTNVSRPFPAPPFSFTGTDFRLVLRTTATEPVPEPGTLALAGLAVGAFVYRRRRNKARGVA